MTKSRKFKYRNRSWSCEAEFFEDRLEYSWDSYGLGVEKGKKVFLVNELSGSLDEGTGSYGSNMSRLPGVYLVLAMFSWALLPRPWRYSTYVFLVMFVYSAILAISRLKKRAWMRIKRINGDTAFSVQVTSWPETEREAFRKFYSEWIKRTAF
jgi:hypothetical protein